MLEVGFVFVKNTVFPAGTLLIVTDEDDDEISNTLGLIDES